MDVPLQIEKMSKEEKIKLMEAIWDDLRKNEDDLPSPDWHENILHERVEKLKKGEDKFVDWEEAKKNIRDSV